MPCCKPEVQGKLSSSGTPLGSPAVQHGVGADQSSAGSNRTLVLFGIRAPCKGGVFQWVQVPPGDGSLQPEAVGAIVEVTKRSKPSAMVTLGDLASVQAGI